MTGNNLGALYGDLITKASLKTEHTEEKDGENFFNQPTVISCQLCRFCWFLHLTMSLMLSLNHKVLLYNVQLRIARQLALSALLGGGGRGGNSGQFAPPFLSHLKEGPKYLQINYDSSTIRKTTRELHNKIMYTCLNVFEVVENDL